MYTIDQNTHAQIMTYLGELPAKFANPLINQLQMLYNQAQEAKKEPTPEVGDSN